MQRLAAFLAIAVFAGPVLAQEADRNCQGPLELGGETSGIRLMRVTATERVHFIENERAGSKACPSLAPACRRKGFVLKDDVLLALAPEGELVCASFIAPKPKRVKGQFAESSGFLPAASLRPEPVPAARAADWLGTWYRNAEAEITIKAGTGGKLVIEGSATYGMHDPYRVRNGGVNEGGLEGETLPRGNMLAIGEGYDGTKPFPKEGYECQARLELFGRYMVVQDSGHCGGANVRFDGIYVKIN